MATLGALFQRLGNRRAARRGEIDAGLRALRGGLEQVGEARFLPRFLLLLGELAVYLGQASEVALGLETVNESLAWCEARNEGWYIPELLRIRGELIYCKVRKTLSVPRNNISAAPSTRPMATELSPGSSVRPRV